MSWLCIFKPIGSIGIIRMGTSSWGGPNSWGPQKYPTIIGVIGSWLLLKVSPVKYLHKNKNLSRYARYWWLLLGRPRPENSKEFSFQRPIEKQQPSVACSAMTAVLTGFGNDITTSFNGSWCAEWCHFGILGDVVVNEITCWVPLWANFTALLY